MANVAFIFPGQGSQYVGMGKQLSEASETSRRVFEEASSALGFDVAALCFSGPENALNQTENTQPAILAVSIAALEQIRENGIEAQIVAGHSLGEYTALVAAGALNFSDALRLVKNRGRYMQEAVESGKGGMAAVLGLTREEVEEVCREAEASGIVSPANINSPGQVVIAGEKAAVQAAGEIALRRGAKRVIPLEVSVPSHCRLMRPAAERLAAELNRVPMNDLRIPVIANVHAKPVMKSGEVRDALVMQLERPVLWVDTILEMKARGIDTFVEIGPGKVLSGLVKRIDREANLLQAEDPESLDSTLRTLGARI